MCGAGCTAAAQLRPGRKRTARGGQAGGMGRGARYGVHRGWGGEGVGGGAGCGIGRVHAGRDVCVMAVECGAIQACAVAVW